MVGNIPNFTKIDILRCFLRFNKNISRQGLAKELELGEGTIRTILKILKSKKLLESAKKGHFLSKKGAEMLSRIYEYVSMPKNTAMSLYPDLKKIGIVLKNVQDLKKLYNLRDIAVKSGADGAVILKFENRLYAPEADYRQDFRELEKNFELRNNEVLVIAFSGKSRNAENGALAIAVELSDFLKKFINEL